VPRIHPKYVTGLVLGMVAFGFFLSAFFIF